MPLRKPDSPEHRMTRMLRVLVSANPKGPCPLSAEDIAFAKSFREQGSWNWMGLARDVYLWVSAYWNRSSLSEALESAEDWFRRQEKEGHMRAEQNASSHYELYLIVAAAARMLAVDASLRELADLAAAWFCRQEALADLGWLAGDDGGNALLPCARAGHGGVSQGVQVCHQLLADLPLARATAKPGWWDTGDMLGPAIVRRLLERGDPFAVVDGTPAVAAGTRARRITYRDLPPSAPLVMNPVVVERSGAGGFRAYVTEWKGGADPCLWVSWSPAAGRQVQWLGKDTFRGTSEPPPLEGAPLVFRVAIGPDGWRDMLTGGPETLAPAFPPIQPSGQPAKPPRVGPGDLPRPDPLDPARELAGRMRAFAETKPAAKGGILDFAAEVEEKFGEARP